MGRAFDLTGLGAARLGLCAIMTLAHVAAAAQAVPAAGPAPLETAEAPVAPEPAAPTTPCGAIASGLCLQALTPLVIRIEAGISSRTAKTGETFALTLAEPLVIDGRVVLPAGISGQGEVVHAKGTGLGVGGELVLAARFLAIDGSQLRLRSMRVGVHGKDQQGLTFATAAMIGLPAMFIRGKHIEIPAGTLAEAKTAQPFVVQTSVPAPPAPVPVPTPEGIHQ